MTTRVWAWLLSLAVLWGCTYFFAKVALGELAPLSVVFGRVAIAALALNLVLAATVGSLFQRNVPWRTFFAMGLLNNLVPFGLIFWGQTQIASALAAILNATTPLFTLIVAHFLTQDERITPVKLAALVIGISGVAVLMGPAALASGDGFWGQIACLGAALSYAFAGIYGRRFKAMGIAPLDAAAGQLTASTMLILPIMLIVDRPWLLPSFPSIAVWASLASLALLSTALAYVLYFRILAAAGATNLLLVTFLIPPTAILLGTVFLGEHLLSRHVTGMALIGFSLVAIDGRLLRFLQPAK
ncbi:MAG: ABC transporter permease [Alphaproteobacteria bacterium 65-37]|nr:DMT family transporter [Alphaproteobacteria bacterium]OJU46621.1 MAG: ABC transporter permease [Alphaproteobacteria bacterium 65-37]